MSETTAYVPTSRTHEQIRIHDVLESRHRMGGRVAERASVFSMALADNGLPAARMPSRFPARAVPASARLRFLGAVGDSPRASACFPEQHSREASVHRSC